MTATSITSFTANEIDYECALILNLLLNYPRSRGYTFSEISNKIEATSKDIAPRLRNLCMNGIVKELRSQDSDAPFSYVVSSNRDHWSPTLKDIRSVVNVILRKRRDYKIHPMSAMDEAKAQNSVDKKTPKEPKPFSLNSLQLNICRLLADTADYVNHSFICRALTEDVSISQVSKACRKLYDGGYLHRVTGAKTGYIYKLKLEYAKELKIQGTSAAANPAKPNTSPSSQALVTLPEFNPDWSSEAQERWLRLFEKQQTI